MSPRAARSQRLAAAAQGLGRHPWVDRTVELAWDRLEAVVGPELMPREEDCDFANLNDLSEIHYNPWDDPAEGEPTEAELLDARGVCLEEFGCGAYGCVLPTWTDGVVLKLGTDASEAFFAAHAIGLGDPPEGGIVRYEHAYRVKWAQREGVPVFVLWRSEAFDIGFPASEASSAGYRALLSAKRAGGNIRGAFADAVLGGASARGDRAAKLLFQLFADGIPAERGRTVATYMKPNGAVWLAELERANEDYRQAGGDSRHLIRLARDLAQYDEAVAALEEDQVLHPVGAAMRFYLENGLVLGDTHANNIGRDADGLAIITDPGVCTPIHSDMFYADIPEV